jgi:hypothetical protein
MACTGAAIRSWKDGSVIRRGPVTPNVELKHFAASTEIAQNTVKHGKNKGFRVFSLTARNRQKPPKTPVSGVNDTRSKLTPSVAYRTVGNLSMDAPHRESTTRCNVPPRNSSACRYLRHRLRVVATFLGGKFTPTGEVHQLQSTSRFWKLRSANCRKTIVAISQLSSDDSSRQLETVTGCDQ